MVNPDSIPRYAEPTWEDLREDDDEVLTCSGCSHFVDRIEGGPEGLHICVLERDEIGSIGKVTAVMANHVACRDYDA